jgi:tetratricopeptide (TPR) repeat protein
MNKQELFKQADYTFQRGNRELAKKYLTDLLTAYPDDEAAWMLLARVVEEKERKVECFERVLKINPKNEEAKLALVRVRASINPTLPLPKQIKKQQPKKISPYRNAMRGALVAVVAVLLLGTSTYVIARNNPDSQVAKVLAITTSTPVSDSALSEDIAPQTRAEVSEEYPQYAPLLDALLGFAVENAQNGMDGAPERPGDKILTSDSSGLEAKSILENNLPQPGTMTTVTITEQQLTSWIAMELKNTPDLPLNEIQVYLRDDTVQIWGMVNGSEGSTSALIVGELMIGDNKYPYFKIESMQIGQQVIPGIFVSQMEAWLNQSLSEAINQQVPGLSLVSLKVTSGLITVSGTR